MLTDKIWYKLANIKYGEIYLSKYLDMQRSNQKRIKVITLIVSFSGILSWKYFENYVWIALLLIGIMQIFLLVKDSLFRSEKEVEDIALLKIKYTEYFIKIDKLWTELTYDSISIKKAINVFYNLESSIWQEIEELDGRINVKHRKKIMRISEVETSHFLNKNYNDE